jgi:hypothetical protein
MTTKDDAIIALAVRHLTEGSRTVYVTSLGHDRMRAMLERIVAAAPAELIRRVYYGRGDERIHARNGNTVIFRTSRGSGPRGLTADVLLLDEVSDQVYENAVPCLAGSPVAELHRWP